MGKRWIVAAVVIGAAAAYAAALRGGERTTERVPAFEQLPLELSDWRGQDYPTSDAVSRVLAADAVLNRCYRRADGAQVWLFVGYFARQQVNTQIHSPRHCLPGGGWRIASIRRERLTIDAAPRAVTRIEIAQAGQAQEVFYWFRTRRGVTTGEYALKWDLVRNSLARRPTNAAMVRFNAATGDSAALRDLMNRVEAPLNRILEPVGL